MSTDDDSILDRISTVTELNDLSRQMNDPKLDEALDLIIKLTLKPEGNPSAVPKTIVLARALAAEFKIKAKYLMIFDKKEAQRKNIYFSVAEELVGLADALKYLVRNT